MSEYYYWASAEKKRCERLKGRAREACLKELMKIVKIEMELEEELWGPMGPPI